MKYELAYEPFEFDFDATYTAEEAGGGGGIAWRVTAYESETDEDSYWTGYANPTGRVIAHMVGDDRDFSFDPTELTKISESDYCYDCGQVGCGWHTGEED
jgi:hypothetical protein